MKYTFTISKLLNVFAAKLTAKRRIALLVILVGLCGLNNTATGQTFTNATGIIGADGANNSATPAPYPSNITISGLSGSIADITVAVNGLTSDEFPLALQLLLVGPGGRNLVLLADASANSVTPPTKVNLNFSDQASFVSQGDLISGTYRPTSYDNINPFPSPAPASFSLPGHSNGGQSLASTFGNTSANGVWSLYAFNNGAAISISSWSITVSIATITLASTTTVLASNNNPSYTAAPNNPVIFTATVLSSSSVNEGTVNFTSNGTTIPGGGVVAVAGGTASVHTNFTTAGPYTIVATYSGSSNFSSSSSNSLSQQVNVHPATINSITANSAHTNAATQTFAVTFGASVTGLSASNFSLTTTGNISGASVGTISGSGASYTVTVNTGTGDGTIGLNLNNASGLSPGISNTLPFSGGTTTIDKTAPTVLSITATSPSNSGPTNASEFTYTVTFSEAVTGVDASAFTLSRYASDVNETNIAVNAVSASVYTVVIDATPLDASDQMQLSLNNGSNITDLAGNVLANTLDGDTYTLDQTPPTVNTITAESPTSPTNAASVTFRVNFSEAVQNVVSGDFKATTSGVTETGISVSQVDGANYDVAVSGISGNGALRLDLNEGTGITDLAGNQIQSGFTTGDVYTIDQAPPVGAPTFTSNGLNSTVATAGNLVTLEVIYNEKITTPVVTINGQIVTAVNTSGNTWDATYTVTSADSGNIGFDINATDLFGNSAELTSATSNYIAVDNSPFSPTISSPSASSVTNNGTASVKYTVSYGADIVAGNLDQTGIVLNTTGSATGDVSVVTLNGKDFTVTISNITGVGMLGISVKPGNFENGVGNYDTGGGPSATFNVLNSDARLSGISLSSGTLNPGFGQAQLSYAVSVSTGSITITPTIDDPNASVTVNGVSPSTSVNLGIGANVIPVVVTAQDGVTQLTYSLTVTRFDASLSNIALSTGTVSPTFTGSNTGDYKVTVPWIVSGIMLTPTAADVNATIDVAGNTVSSGTQSPSVPLALGSNTIQITVTAPDGVTQKIYTVIVTRAPSNNANLSRIQLSPGLALTETSSTATAVIYTASAKSSISSVTLTPFTGNAGAAVMVNGKPVVSGMASDDIPLSTGPNTITAVVTAQNGKVEKTYTIIVTRVLSVNANLATIKLNPSLALTQTSATATMVNYTASAKSSINSVTVTPTTIDAGATVMVNGNPVNSGIASTGIPLAVGQTTITTVVTAQDGTTKKTYIVTVTRAPSVNANLGSIQLNPRLVLTQTSATDEEADYTASAKSTVNSVTLTPFTIDPTATVTVNGDPVTSGTPSADITLVTGPNKITTVVTAGDKTTMKTYIVTITKAAASLNIAYQPVSVSNPTDRPQMMGEEITVHQGISPNGDGINDFLIIDNIASHPNNKLQIMNRSGQLIYEAVGYDNSTNVFDGHSNKNGQMQLPGTYFYSLDYTDNGETKHKTGFIVLMY